jgi:hypothetical protein
MSNEARLSLAQLSDYPLNFNRLYVKRIAGAIRSTTMRRKIESIDNLVTVGQTPIDGAVKFP